jgi:RNase P protein component
MARESFRELDLRALDFIVMAKHGAARAESKQLRRSLDAHFQQLSAKSATTGEGHKGRHG